ncbi:alpha/beta hydrolase family protein [Kordiimonas gwangyangensis]|uniref:alpha/beta hydrolase family protein n=1 Tax=Kordiimonas gwangyangensis TaxID=288022 RepID=UPI0003606334|nr:alpha/beta hydrolase [Kordiimonas gwangyangensis]
MKRFIIGLMVLVWATAPASADPAPADIAGDWIGTLQTPGGKLSLVLTITEDKDGSLAAVLESPDQAPGQKIPVTSVSVTDGVLEFTSRAIGATYKGTWTGKAWQGDFNQGMALPLEFKRGELAPKPVLKGLDGEWTAEIVRNGQTIGFALTVETTERGTSATFAVPAMMAYGLPVADLSLDGDAFSFSVPAVASSFTGTFSGADAPIAGIWQRKGQEALETAFIRTSDKAAEVKRPQMPQEPFPYRSVDVSMPNAAAKGVTLSGTLTLPEGDGPFPAAILISGSGPQDRDETLLGHKPFAVLADYLTRQGIAVLRYDDRGFGRSTGDYGTSTSADFATDANAAFAFLAAREDIKAGAIGFIGHSEGGLVAPIAAKANDALGYIVFLAGPGVPTRELLVTQRRVISMSNGASEADVTRVAEQSESVLDAVATASSTEDAHAKLEVLLTPEVMQAMGMPPERKQAAISQLTNNWFRYFLKHDPVPYLRALEMPVLALNGSLDQQVDAADNLAGMRAAFAEHRDATVVELPGLNHMFQTAKTGGLDEYMAIEETFSPKAMEMIAAWINARF